MRDCYTAIGWRRQSVGPCCAMCLSLLQERRFRPFHVDGRTRPRRVLCGHGRPLDLHRMRRPGARSQPRPVDQEPRMATHRAPHPRRNLGPRVVALRLVRRDPKRERRRSATPTEPGAETPSLAEPASDPPKSLAPPSGSGRALAQKAPHRPNDGRHGGRRLAALERGLRQGVPLGGRLEITMDGVLGGRLAELESARHDSANGGRLESRPFIRHRNVLDDAASQEVHEGTTHARVRWSRGHLDHMAYPHTLTKPGGQIDDNIRRPTERGLGRALSPDHKEHVKGDGLGVVIVDLDEMRAFGESARGTPSSRGRRRGWRHARYTVPPSRALAPKLPFRPRIKAFARRLRRRSTRAPR